MSYREEEYLQLSGLQHFAFCRRQWALIHIEQQWADNLRTVEGNLMHENAHDEVRREKRPGLIITRGMPIHSPELGVSGQCDVVEFHQVSDGISLQKEKGLWQPYPVEYKRGKPKEHQADELQLCGQAMCLEEMLCCSIPSGSLYYGETRRRQEVCFTDELREKVKSYIDEMHQMFERKYTPRVKPKKECGACSMKELCLPVLLRRKTVKEYLNKALEEEP